MSRRPAAEPLLPGTSAAARMQCERGVSTPAHSLPRRGGCRPSRRSPRGSSPTHPPAARCSVAEPQHPSSGREASLRLSCRLSFVQCLYEKLVRAMDLRLYRSDRDAELGRDLLVLIPLDVVEDERCPRASRKSRNCPLQIDPQIRRIARREGPYLTRVLHWQHPRDTTLVASRVLQHCVHGEPVQPRRKR